MSVLGTISDDLNTLKNEKYPFESEKLACCGDGCPFIGSIGSTFLFTTSLLAAATKLANDATKNKNAAFFIGRFAFIENENRKISK